MQGVSYTPATPNEVSQIKNRKQTKFMKINTLQITLSAVVASSLALLAATTIAVSVSYLAVGILIALAVMDYRPSTKSYLAR